ncbi:MAG: hypothetical protein GF401_05505 [Chitinivibrionales bacterium]|nr:hypothetical protein [Chitinivibrionales bacterium]
MARLLIKFGRRLVVSKRHKQVRSSIIFLFTNFLGTMSILFAIEVLLIMCGLENICLPINYGAIDILSKVIF